MKYSIDIELERFSKKYDKLSSSFTKRCSGYSKTINFTFLRLYRILHANCGMTMVLKIMDNKENVKLKFCSVVVNKLIVENLQFRRTIIIKDHARIFEDLDK